MTSQRGICDFLYMASFSRPQLNTGSRAGTQYSALCMFVQCTIKADLYFILRDAKAKSDQFLARRKRKIDLYFVGFARHRAISREADP